MDSWIKHVWVSSQECGISLLSNFANILPQWQGDIELMQLFVQNGWKQTDLVNLNQCWMHLRVFLLLDITSGLGCLILPQFWDHLGPADLTFA